MVLLSYNELSHKNWIHVEKGRCFKRKTHLWENAAFSILSALSGPAVFWDCQEQKTAWFMIIPLNFLSRMFPLSNFTHQMFELWTVSWNITPAVFSWMPCHCENPYLKEGIFTHNFTEQTSIHFKNFAIETVFMYYENIYVIIFLKKWLVVYWLVFKTALCFFKTYSYNFNNLLKMHSVRDFILVQLYV